MSRQRAKIDLNELLMGSPVWVDVVEFWKLEEFDEEYYYVDAIKKYLLTEEQRKLMFTFNMSIEDMLNGRLEREDQRNLTLTIFSEWNYKLGFKCFGF